MSKLHWKHYMDLLFKQYDKRNKMVITNLLSIYQGFKGLFKDVTKDIISIYEGSANEHE